MQINGNTDATLFRRSAPSERGPGRVLNVAIGKLRETGEMLLAHPAAQRRLLFVDTASGRLTAPELERMRTRNWQ